MRQRCQETSRVGIAGSWARRRRGRRWGAVLAGAVMVAAGAGQARATTDQVVLSGNGNWLSASWNEGHTPQGGEEADVLGDNTGSHTMTLNVTSTPTLGSLVIGGDYIGTGPTISFLQAQGTMTTSGNENVGTVIFPGGTGDYNQTGGANHVGGFLLVGQSNSLGSLPNGTYELSGTGSLSAAEILVGQLTRGTFVQSGGTVNYSNYLKVGDVNGDNLDGIYGRGSYSLSGTGVMFGGTLYVADEGAQGTFTQSGSSFNVPAAAIVGEGTHAAGTFFMNGGTFMPETMAIVGALHIEVAQPLTVGNNSGFGTFDQSGGTVGVSGLTLGQSGGSGLFYERTGGILSATAITLGATGGTGTFAQLGGTVTATSIVFGDSTAGSAGSYSILAGTLTTGAISYTTGAGLFLEGGEVETTATISTGMPVVAGSFSSSTVGLAPDAGTTLTLTGLVEDMFIGAAGNLVVRGPGTVVLANAANTYTGGTTINSGVVQVSADGDLGAINSAGTGYAAVSFGESVIFQNGHAVFTAGTLDATGSFSTSRVINVGSFGGTVEVDGSATVTLTTGVIGSGGLTKAGTGTLVLGAAGTFSGGLTVAAGTLVVGPVPSTAATMPLGTGPVTLAGGTLALQGGYVLSAMQQTVAATGFNQDVVIESGAASAQGAVTTGFDHPNNGGGFAFFETGYLGQFTNLGVRTGLPGDLQFTSHSNSSVNFELEPYNGSNVLLVPAGNGNSGTLTLENMGKFSTLSFLAAAANGSALTGVKLLFSDGTTDTLSAQTVPDWFTSNVPYALSVNGRYGLPNGGFDNLGNAGGFPLLYEFDMAVPTADQSKFLTGVSFQLSGSGGSLGVFALSGNGGVLASGQAYTNAVTVTADSTIAIQGYTTLGNLAIGTNTLTITGALRGETIPQLAFAQTTLSGAATFNVGTGTYVALNSVLGTGSVTKTGGGNLYLGGFAVPNVTLTSLTINAGYVGLDLNFPLLTTGALTIAGSAGNWGGQYDISPGRTVVNNGNVTNIRSQLFEGYNAAGTHWTGMGIISSNLTPGEAVAYITGADYSAVHGSLFGGVTVAPTDVLLTYTWAGDATMDGEITVADYAHLDAGFLLGHYDGVTKIAQWVNGDFNYDGVVDYRDYALIDYAYANGGAPLAASMIAEHAAEFGPAYVEALASLSGGAVPEPGSLALLGVGVLGLVGRRRGRGRTKD